MTYETRILVDDCITEMCFQAPRAGFYPTAIEKHVELPLESVFSRLVDLAEEEVLSLRWEVRCPDYDCAEVVQSFDILPHDILGNAIQCSFGHEFSIQLDMIFPVFKIKPEYRSTVRRLKKNKLRTLAPRHIH